MRFKLDENVHPAVADLLADAGHDALTVRQQGMQGCFDDALVDHFRGESRILVSLDLDFADLRTYPPAKTAGLIILRLHSQSRRHLLATMSRLIALLDQEPIVARLWIVSESGVRIRE
jgi:predicted nuclease of predicted toxin-antitoxin system